eukprot:gene15641-18549_t
MSRIDYSKWDNIDVSDDEDEFLRPEVTKYALAGAPAEGATVQIDDSGLTRNGGATTSYLWSQTQAECVLRVIAPPNTRARDVQVDLRDQHIRVTLKGSPETVLLDDKLLHPVQIYGDDGEKETVDWQVTDWSTDAQQRRLVNVTMLKVVPGHNMMAPGEGVVFWWKAMFEGGPEIDTTVIADRKQKNVQQEVWEQAQAMFKEKELFHGRESVGGERAQTKEERTAGCCIDEEPVESDEDGEGEPATAGCCIDEEAVESDEDGEGEPATAGCCIDEEAVENDEDGESEPASPPPLSAVPHDDQGVHDDSDDELPKDLRFDLGKLALDQDEIDDELDED